QGLFERSSPWESSILRFMSFEENRKAVRAAPASLCVCSNEAGMALSLITPSVVRIQSPTHKHTHTHTHTHTHLHRVKQCMTSTYTSVAIRHTHTHTHTHSHTQAKEV